MWPRACSIAYPHGHAIVHNFMYGFKVVLYGTSCDLLVLHTRAHGLSRISLHVGRGRLYGFKVYKACVTCRQGACKGQGCVWTSFSQRVTIYVILTRNTTQKRQIKYRNQHEERSPPLASGVDLVMSSVVWLTDHSDVSHTPRVHQRAHIAGRRQILPHARARVGGAPRHADP